MGLRCLLGHDFSEPEVEREREEEGSEVVTTVREIKRCDRCGETQIVSENTEVTTLDQLTDQAAVEAVTDATDPEDGTTEPGTAGVAIDDGTASASDSGDATAAVEPTAADTIPDADGAVTVTTSETADAPPTDTATADGDDGAEILDAGPAESESTAAADSGSESIDDEASTLGDASAVSTAEDGLASEDGLAADEELVEDERIVEDDSEILAETTDAAPDRDHGAWPDMDKPEPEPGEPTPWPEQAAEDEGYDAQIDDTSGESGVQFGGGLTPAADPTTPEAKSDTEYIEAPSADAPAEHFDTSTSDDDDDPAATGDVDTVDTGIQHASETDHVVLDDRGETEYYCPSCEMTREANGSSLRAGDICPGCKRGYIDERSI